MIIAIGLISGLLLGVLFGVILQRGRFCMNSAFQDIILMKNYTLLKSIAAAIVVQMIGFMILVGLGVISALNPRPFYVVSVIIGGLIFGIGMVLAAGCLSGTMYRVGEGMIGSVIALGGFIFVIILNSTGLFTGLLSFFNGLGRITVVDDGPFVENNNPTLANIFGIHPWILVGIIASIITFILIWTSRKEKIKIPTTEGTLNEEASGKGLNWWITGISLGIIGILAFPLSGLAGCNDALCFVCGWESISGFLITGDINQLNWIAFFVIGLIIGAVISAVLANEFKIRIPDAKRLIQQFVGGVMLGMGALIADGCNIGHIFSGIPQLAISSIVMGIFMIIGCWVTVYLIFIREKK